MTATPVFVSLLAIETKKPVYRRNLEILVLVARNDDIVDLFQFDLAAFPGQIGEDWLDDSP